MSELPAERGPEILGADSFRMTYSYTAHDGLVTAIYKADGRIRKLYEDGRKVYIEDNSCTTLFPSGEMIIENENGEVIRYDFNDS